VNFLDGIEIGMHLIKELPLSSPPETVFDRIHSMPFSFFLDSGLDKYKLGKFSFLGYAPFMIFKSKGKRIELTRGTETYTFKGNPFHILDRIFRHCRASCGSTAPPFISGGVGYFAYDLCHFVESLPLTVVDDMEFPDCYLCFYDRVLTYDHVVDKWHISVMDCGCANNSGSRKSIEGYAQESEEEILSILKGSGVKQPGSINSMRSKPDIESNFTREDYLKAVTKAKEFISAGDIYQVNLSQRFHAKLSVDPYLLYKRLRNINPAPFACYLNFDDITIVSSSPERFLKVEGDRVQTRPIKGTRPRGKDKWEDKKLKEELISSIKDRAELNMIVDLERNDLGRVCDYGSVKVTEHAVVETFATVFHLVSTIEGRLLPRYNYIDLLKASFPGGSITGAPKIRAMEIIDELEPTARSVYTGSIGYLGFNDHMDLNIAIRTFLIKDNNIYFQVGGGIVADSTPEGEYDETLDKAKALIQSLTI